MIAELHGKISSSGSNLSDRVEDQLTGDFFGSMRYLPFDLGLKPVLLSSVHPPAASEIVGRCSVGYWADKIQFWPYDQRGELDALIALESTLIGIEVKYNSGLSSDDEISYMDTAESSDSELTGESINQLHRESLIISERCRGSQKGLLLFIAKDACCREVYRQTMERNLISQKVMLSYAAWEDILAGLCALSITEPFAQTVVSDLICLLKRKGFERFRNMELPVGTCISPNYFFHYKDTLSLRHRLRFNFNSISIKEGQFYEYK